MVAQLRDECRPVFLDEPLAHKGDALEQKGGNLVIRAAHQEADQVLLHDLETLLVDQVGWVVFIIGQGLLLLALGEGLLVVGEIVML